MQNSGVQASLLRDPTISTIVKLRVIAKQQQLLRIDFENEPVYYKLENDIFAAAGIDARDRIFERGAAVRAVFPEPGRITGITGVADALDLPGVHQIFIWKQPGDMVGPYLNSADRCAFVIADGETTREAIANAERGVARVRIETVRA